MTLADVYFDEEHPFRSVLCVFAGLVNGAECQHSLRMTADTTIVQPHTRFLFRCVRKDTDLKGRLHESSPPEALPSFRDAGLGVGSQLSHDLIPAASSKDREDFSFFPTLVGSTRCRHCILIGRCPLSDEETGWDCRHYIQLQVEVWLSGRDNNARGGARSGSESSLISRCYSATVGSRRRGTAWKIVQESAGSAAGTGSQRRRYILKSNEQWTTSNKACLKSRSWLYLIDCHVNKASWWSDPDQRQRECSVIEQAGHVRRREEKSWPTALYESAITRSPLKNLSRPHSSLLGHHLAVSPGKDLDKDVAEVEGGDQKVKIHFYMPMSTRCG